MAYRENRQGPTPKGVSFVRRRPVSKKSATPVPVAQQAASKRKDARRRKVGLTFASKV